MDKKYNVPWEAWRDPEFLELGFPDSWDVTMCHMNDISEINDEEIKNSILNPIETQKISELAKGKESLPIPAPTSKIVFPFGEAIFIIFFISFCLIS